MLNDLYYLLSGLSYMQLGTILLLALALSLDAFAAALSCGIKLPRLYYRGIWKVSLAFGFFQGMMPILGHYFSSALLHRWIASYGPWLQALVFTLLAFKTFYDYFHEKIQQTPCSSCHCRSIRCLLALAIATSIDAFLIGAVLGLAGRELFHTAIIIGIVTWINSLAGVLLGNLSLHILGPLQSKAKFLAALLLLVLAILSLLDLQ